MDSIFYRYLLITVIYAIAWAGFVLIYRKRLDELITDHTGELAPSKIGTIVASTAWTHYMLTLPAGEIPQSHLYMWLAFFCAVAATELFKKFMTMWFSRGMPIGRKK